MVIPRVGGKGRHLDVSGGRRRERPPNNFAHNAIFSSVSYAFPPAASLVTMPILAHRFGVDGRGVIAAAVVPVLFSVASTTLGLPEAAVHFTARQPRIARALLKVLLPMAAVLGFLGTAAITSLANLLSGHDHAVAGYVALASFAVAPSLAITVARGFAIGLQQWALVRAEQFIGALLSVGTIVLLNSVGHLSILTAILCILGSPVAGGLIYLRLRLPSTSVRSSTQTIQFSGGSVANYALRTWIGSISGIALARLDQTLMTSLAGQHQLGLYVAAVNFSEIPLIVTAVIGQISFSSDSAKNDDARLTATARLLGSFTIILGIFIGATLPITIPILFGSAFYPAVPATIVLLTAIAIGAPISVLGAGLGARGHPGLRSMALVLAATVNLGLLVVVVPRMGAIGASLATLSANIVGGAFALIAMKRVSGISPLAFWGLRRTDVRLALGGVAGIRRKSPSEAFDGKAP
jgi:O-antigen/teichoic acid export membrane protein